MTNKNALLWQIIQNAISNFLSKFDPQKWPMTSDGGRKIKANRNKAFYIYNSKEWQENIPTLVFLIFVALYSHNQWLVIINTFPR